jgi:signal transduction histidine kinase
MRGLARSRGSPPAMRAIERRLVGAVGGIPIRVQTKLLAAFLMIGALLVVVGTLGLRVIGESNDRVEQLGGVRDRAALYRELQTDASQLRLMLGLRTGVTVADQGAYVGEPASSAGPDLAGLLEIDGAIQSTLTRPGRPTDLTHPGFVPPRDEQDALAAIQDDYRQLANTMAAVVAFDQAQAPSQTERSAGEQRLFDLVFDLQQRTQALADAAEAEASRLVEDNRAAFGDSQRQFIGVAAASIALALLLGYVLSRSLVGPITRMEARLAAIASGDFSGHVDVANRDELGTLAANLNRMNDELGRLYRELDDASRHKSAFLANMSHELRTPLNAIIGFSEVLDEQMFGPLNEAQQQYVRDVLSAGRHLLSLINDILDLSKIEAGHMELVLADVSIPDVLQAGLSMQRPRADRAGIDLTMSVDAGVDVVRADERKVRQVVFNLLSNAVKFTPRGGRIEVGAHRIDGAVEIAVTDSGIGIAPEDQERIFQEFQQARPGAGGFVEGTGLGLALARRFVELHGGRLSVTSEIGRGSTFRFTLPLETAA